MVNESRTFELTAKKKDFSEWYAQVVEAAGFVDRKYDLKGMFVWLGYGYKAMNAIRKFWDKRFQEEGIEELYFPLIVPIKYCEQNESWWKGFKSEGYKVIAGQNNEIQGALRPTGEPAMYPMFSQWVQSRNDLPIRVYETVSSFRFETRQTRPLVRDREITVWHEIHTAHATKEESQKEMELHMKLYDDIWEYLALAPLKVNKPKWECFPGAVGAVEYYNFIQETGRVMENGSVNNLGQAYAEKFNIRYHDENEKEHHVWQLCTGNGGRLLAAVISTHGDDKGLVLPPDIAPIQVVVIPIIVKGREKEIEKKAEDIGKKLQQEGLRVRVDKRDISPGRKFYDWEIKGAPIRLEIGPKDMAKKQVILVQRDTGKKHEVAEGQITKEVKKIHANMYLSMLKKAKKELDGAVVDVNKITEIEKVVNGKKIARMFWCEDEKCYDKISALEEGFEGFGVDVNTKKVGVCIQCNKKAKERLYVARSY